MDIDISVFIFVYLIEYHIRIECRLFVFVYLTEYWIQIWITDYTFCHKINVLSGDTNNLGLKT